MSEFQPSSNRASQFPLPPQTHFRATVLANTTIPQRVEILVGGNTEPAAVFTGTAQEAPRSQILNSGDGNVRVDVFADGKKAETDARLAPIEGTSVAGTHHTVHFGLIAAGGSGSADFNDTVVLLQWPVDESLADYNGSIGGNQTQRGNAPWKGSLSANNEPGVNTGVTVKKGDRLSIVVSGWARAGTAADHHWCGPQGNKQKPGESKFLLPSAALGAVLIQIGSDLYYIGTGAIDWVAPADGQIVFRFNDAVGVYGDNQGAFDITLRHGTA
ncbi:LecA/PA-IL family lectin [Burkholderia cenocepacia]|uniref:LecA/PA-IL family lectin n=1 Tax=Burkholderia cenocepacia TaxID=95486 RepID=UPI002864DEFD|nr:LecA/PA-IL family lectin [Burkholderia cenocepacia]MDR8047996.1 hypothetical protein [Burkholderia cenocepacia]